MQYLDAVSKNDRMISVHFQGKPFNITVIEVYAQTSNNDEDEVDSAVNGIIPAAVPLGRE